MFKSNMFNVHYTINKEEYDKQHPERKLTPDSKAFYNDYLFMFCGINDNNHFLTPDNTEYEVCNGMIYPITRKGNIYVLYDFAEGKIGKLTVDTNDLISIEAYDFYNNKVKFEQAVIKHDAYRELLKEGLYNYLIVTKLIGDYGFKIEKNKEYEILDIVNRIYIKKDHMNFVIAKNQEGKIVDYLDMNRRGITFYEACKLIFQRNSISLNKVPEEEVVESLGTGKILK